MPDADRLGCEQLVIRIALCFCHPWSNAGRRRVKLATVVQQPATRYLVTMLSETLILPTTRDVSLTAQANSVATSSDAHEAC